MNFASIVALLLGYGVNSNYLWLQIYTKANVPYEFGYVLT